MPPTPSAIAKMVDQESFYAEVGKRISKVRLQRRLTQEALADAVALTRTSITNIERGRQKLPLYTLAVIAATLDVDFSALLPPTKPVERNDFEQSLGDRPAAEREFIKSAMQSVASK
jgi:transcriptional regulator with XRE-family HTH domain